MKTKVRQRAVIQIQLEMDAVECRLLMRRMQNPIGQSLEEEEPKMAAVRIGIFGACEEALHGDGQ